ncbi:Lysine 2,3-aminomutase [Desulfamplus magnetovallimortis]|uniref:Lysine 2,3-aminomutase n=1 Tax=Desulfamplus magnetovallimortis TaxID=1246637 RepID=A0A1W1H5V5_9BACT|nr:KamA family radical SAM protein [Desulfamplus magnetovallimortis]SLM27859.1 Lysine 2,3-aminomutase [Desulfamplus magnetovallimortis]
MKTLDILTSNLINDLFQKTNKKVSSELLKEFSNLLISARESDLTAPVIELFSRLCWLGNVMNCSPLSVGISRESLEALAAEHESTDEHNVSIGGRVGCAMPIVESAIKRVDAYLNEHKKAAPSGFELWDTMLENKKRIMNSLNMDESDWNSYSGQLQHCIDSVDDLAKIIDLPMEMEKKIRTVTKKYRMRLTPYYASLIQTGFANDPVLLQSVPTIEMLINPGDEIPPVAADHSPARLIDQFYPRVAIIKATNMCAMYCTHCLRIAHIGKKDQIYPEQAYEEAIDYIRANHRIRDVLVTGGDAFALPNKMIQNILKALDDIDHVKVKRLGTRIPVTVPQRVDSELLDILAASNDKKPLRISVQINTAQEVTPVSGEAFKNISKSVSALLNQAVLLKGVNDTRVKMWKLCETIHENYVRPYYLFNCSYRNPEFAHFRVPIEIGQDIVESMYGNISGDAIPRYIATAGGKVPLHRSNIEENKNSAPNTITLVKPWNGERVDYPDADKKLYENKTFAFLKP